MGFLSKLFGKKSSKPPIESSADPANDPNMICVYDEYGRDMYIHRDDWRDNVLMGNIEKAKSNPDELYSIIIQSLNDEFFEEVVDATEHLYKTDPIPSRSAVTLGIVYMKNGRLGEAEKVLNDFIKKYGEDGIVLTNLAKIYAEKGDNVRAEKTLWHALELDPNQDNGFGWYEAIHRERAGEAASLEAMRRVAALPGSWRAQLWLAREELESKKLKNALNFYKESLSNAPNPIPTDLFMQMSGDLGNNGYINEIIELVEPHYDYSVHGLSVGNNLIKAYIELGNPEQARNVVNKLYSLNRPDWAQHLNFWETEIAQTRLKGEKESDLPLEMSIASIEGPLWMRDGSPFSELLSPKDNNAPEIVFWGSTVIRDNSLDKAESQIADSRGRLSRTVPLVLAEHCRLTTNSKGSALIPWINDKGFAVFGKPYTDNDLCDIASKNEKASDFIAGITVDISNETWVLILRLVSVRKAEFIEEIQVSVDSKNPGPGVEQLITSFKKLICEQPPINSVSVPEWYKRPLNADASNYLLRLEQQLALFCYHVEFLKGGGLSGEREILDGGLRLSLNHPKNPTVRMLFIQTLRQMQKVRPDILPEFKKKIESLQEKNPIPGKVGELVARTVNEVY